MKSPKKLYTIVFLFSTLIMIYWLMIKFPYYCQELDYESFQLSYSISDLPSEELDRYINYVRERDFRIYSIISKKDLPFISSDSAIYRTFHITDYNDFIDITEEVEVENETLLLYMVYNNN